MLVRPRARSNVARIARPYLVGLLVAICWLSPAWFISARSAFGEQLRVRIAWGEGAARKWRGGVSVSEGRVLEVRGLGLTSDSPGSIYLNTMSGRIEIRESSPRVYNGVDLLVEAPLDAQLKLQLQADNDPPAELSTTLRALATEAAGRGVDLDQRGNRALMQRAPGDALRLQFERDSMVMATGEALSFRVQPHLLTALASSELLCRVRLLQGDEEVDAQEQPIVLDAQGSAVAIPYQFTMPEIEGVFAFEVSLRRRPRVPWLPSASVASRRVQVVSIDSQPQDFAPDPWREVYGFDPANKGWFDRVARLPGFNAIPGLSLTPVQSEQHTPRIRTVEGQQMTELPAGGWVAYPLSIAPDQLHLPHVLELEYPTDVEQSFSVSILEPNRSGEVIGDSVDSGVSVDERWATEAPKLERHRLIFWPRTTNPFVLLAGKHPTAPTVFGRIRVLAGPARLDERVIDSLEQTANAFAAPSGDRQVRLDERMIAAFFQDPGFSAAFGSDKAADPARPLGSLDDWYTFYRGGARLAQYLRFAGYNSAVICVARDGGSIYPSEVLEATPRHDNGVFFPSGQDPIRKDVLEMLFRIFDREGLRLIPAVHLSGTSPRLERLRRDGEAGVALEAFGGATRFDGRLPTTAPFYNALHPEVQNEVRRVVAELSTRYGSHPSFGGVALQSGADTWTQMPDAFLGVDRETLTRFAEDTGRHLNDELVRFTQAADRSAWLRWRAEQLAAFHQRLDGLVAQNRRGARLLLTTEDSLAAPAVQASLRPRPGQPDMFREQLMRVGLSPELYRDGAVLLRPYRYADNGNVAFDAANVTLNQPYGSDALFGGVQLHHPSTIRTLPKFDERSPFTDARTRLRLRSTLTSSGQDHLRRFARALAAQDVQVLLDGGDTPPLGQAHVARTYLRLLRKLPATPFEDVPHVGSGGASAVVVRQHQTERRGQFLYAVNQAPWPVEVRVELSGAVTAGGQPIGDAPNGQVRREANDVWVWRVNLGPYEVGATSLANGVRGVRCSSFEPQVVLSKLRRRIENIQRRIAGKNREASEKPPNLSFEQPVAAGQPIPGWKFAEGAGFTVDIQPDGPTRVLHLKNSDGARVLWSRSSQFTPPETGMLAVRVRLRTRGDVQPHLAVAIDNQVNYYDPLYVGKGTGHLVDSKWRDYPFLFKLPPDLKQIAIGFDLHGEGEIWIDRIELFDIWLEPEHASLTLHSGMAKNDLVRGNAFQCQLFLESYWPQFLLQHDPAATPRAARAPQPNRGWRFPSLPKPF